MAGEDGRHTPRRMHMKRNKFQITCNNKSVMRVRTRTARRALTERRDSLALRSQRAAVDRPRCWARVRSHVGLRRTTGIERQLANGSALAGRLVVLLRR